LQQCQQIIAFIIKSIKLYCHFSNCF